MTFLNRFHKEVTERKMRKIAASQQSPMNSSDFAQYMKLSAGSKALQILLHLNKRLHHVWCGFFIAHISCGNRLVASLVEELPVEHGALSSVSVYGDGLLSFEQEYFYCVAVRLEVGFDVGGEETCPPEDVAEHMEALLDDYHASHHTFQDILDLHVRFERIHPFQDGNGRMGRLIMFKECLNSSIVPFIITDELKMFYYCGLREWGHINGYLTDTSLTAQDQYKAALDYFRIQY